MVYFDNAATTFPKPLTVKNAVDLALMRYGANPGRSGHDLSVETAAQVFAAREAAASFFDAADVENVAFTQNCTYAINTVVKGLLQKGDHVVISDLEHNSVLRPVHGLSSRGGISYTVAAAAPGNDDETVAAFRRALRPETKLILCTHASNVFGVKLPIGRLAALAHEHGCLFAADAAQTAGTEPISMREMGLDFLCAAGHKGLYGPSGTGLLVTPHGAGLAPLAEGGTGSLSMEYDQPEFMPDRLEAGTLNTAGIIGLGAGISFLNRRGIESIARYEIEVARCIYEGLQKIDGVLLYTSAPRYGENLPVISFNVGDFGSEETAARMNSEGFALRGGYHCAPLAHQKYGTLGRGTARASIGAFNTVEQAQDLVAAVGRIARKSA